MPRQNFDIDSWTAQELAQEQERIRKLGMAFTRFTALKSDMGTPRFTPSDVVLGAQEVYGYADQFAIFGLLQEAVSAGVIDSTEVGGRNDVLYQRHHAIDYLMHAEAVGLLKWDDGKYLPTQ